MVDPFFGIGSTAEVAILCGCNFAGCDKDAAVFLPAKACIERVLQQHSLKAKILNLPDPVPVELDFDSPTLD